MLYTMLGHTDISISRICLGTMTWGGQNTSSEAFAQMDYALERGVNFWDTAEMYGIPPTAETYGTTETIIGDWFAQGKRRDEVVLATKFSPLPWARGEALMNPSSESIARAVDESLKRLQSDYIDLYQLHWPTNRPNLFGASWWDYVPPQTQGAKEQIVANIHEVLEALDQQVRVGKLRSVGLSNDTAWGMSQHLRLSELHDLVRIVSLQNEYSLLRRHVERNIAETCSLEGISFLAWSPLAMGILSGKYVNGQFPAGSRFSPEIMRDQFHHFKTRLTPAVDRATECYQKIAERHGFDVCQMAILFTLRHEYLSSTIIGATTMEQLKTNIDAIDVTLSAEVLQDIAEVYREYSVPF